MPSEACSPRSQFSELFRVQNRNVLESVMFIVAGFFLVVGVSKEAFSDIVLVPLSVCFVRGPCSQTFQVVVYNCARSRIQVQCSAFGKPRAVLCFVGRHRVHEQSPVFATAICLITEMWHAPVRISSCSFSHSWLGATSFLCLPIPFLSLVHSSCMIRLSAVSL